MVELVNGRQTGCTVLEMGVVKERPAFVGEKE